MKVLILKLKFAILRPIKIILLLNKIFFLFQKILISLRTKTFVKKKNVNVRTRSNESQKSHSFGLDYRLIDHNPNPNTQYREL